MVPLITSDFLIKLSGFKLFWFMWEPFYKAQHFKSNVVFTFNIFNKKSRPLLRDQRVPRDFYDDSDLVGNYFLIRYFTDPPEL